MNTILSWIGTPLGWIMYLCYSVAKNYGIALIMFTVLTKLVLLPLAIKQQKGMVKMAMFRPKLEEIQKKYQKNPTKMNEELNALYAEEGYNPMAGCLPTLIQMPILLGLINVIYYPLTHILRLPGEVISQTIEIARTVLGEAGMNSYSAEMSVINAVSRDPGAFSQVGDQVVSQIQSFDFTFFGLDMAATPTFAFNLLLLVPVLSGLSSFVMARISMKMNSATTGETGAAAATNTMMMLMMPLMSTWIAFKVPAGVGIYWLLSNLLMIIQQKALYKYYNPAEMAAKVKAEMELKKEAERKEKIENKKKLKEGEKVEAEKALSQKELNRIKLAAARKRDAEKYGEEYVEVTDEDIQ